MKKLCFLLAVFIISYTDIYSQPAGQFIRIWEKSAALNNLPSWFSSTGNRERGIAVNRFFEPPHLYVISNLPEPRVLILNGLTGDSIGTLNTTGISGGLLALSDITTFDYHAGIYACNLTDNPQISPFKIYKWDSESSTPQVIMSDSISNFRLGDFLTSYDGWMLHLTTASSGNSKIVDYFNEYGIYPLTRQQINLADGNLGSNASAHFNDIDLWSGGYFINSDNNRPKAYNTSGSLLSVTADTIISTQNNSLKFFSNNLIKKTKENNFKMTKQSNISFTDASFYTTYNYNSNKAELVLSQGTSNENYWSSTPSLGSNLNPLNYGDVEFSWRAMDTVYIYVLGGNNGIGAYFAKGLVLPVELISFFAAQENDQIKLNWSTATEINNKGFDIQRRSAERLWSTIGFIHGNGTTTAQSEYTYSDQLSRPGKYFYRLKQIDYDGSFKFSESIEIDYNSVPDKFSMLQNYPNPFNPVTAITYSIPENSFIQIVILDALGREIKEIVSEEKTAGTYNIIFDAGDLSSGVYYYQLRAGELLQTKKMVLIK